MSARAYVLILGCLVLSGCLGAGGGGGARIKDLGGSRVEVQPGAVADGGLDKAIDGYRAYLRSASNAALRAQAMRRLADLEMERLEAAHVREAAQLEESGRAGMLYPAARRLKPTDYQSAIGLYEELLRAYPDSAGNDRVLYQLAHAYEQSGDVRQTLRTLNQLVASYPQAKHIDEAQFRRGELLFVMRSYAAAEQAYAAVVGMGKASPFYEKSLYKHGWSLFKQLRYESALDSFLAVLDRRFSDPQTEKAVDEPQHLTRGEKELLDDTFRVVSLSFSYLDGERAITRYLREHGERTYAHTLYQSLGELYLKQERYVDAANAYNGFVSRYADDRRAPELQLKVMEAYKQGGFASLLLQAKEEFVVRYGVNSRFWAEHDEATRTAVGPHLKANIEALARHYHAQAQRNKKKADYREAARWYTEFVRTFSQDARAPEMNFLLAESLLEGERYTDAALAYEQTAYQYPVHKRSAEAGYAAILAHQKREQALKPGERKDYKRFTVLSALRFAETFPGDTRAAAVLTKAAEELYALNDFEQAAAAAQRVTVLQPTPATALRRTAWTVMAHARFEQGAYVSAEQAYNEAFRLAKTGDPARAALIDGLAASVYKQGEQLRAAGDARGAIAHFLRVGEVASTSPLAATAEYDAAADLIGLQDWGAVIPVLERFRKRYPRHPLQDTVPEKLALAYVESGKWSDAAVEFETIANLQTDPRTQQEALWQAAELFDKAGKRSATATAYARYIERFPHPLERALEARHRLAMIHAAAGQRVEQHRRLREIVNIAGAPQQGQTDRIKYLTAKAAFLLAEPDYLRFRKIALVIPLKRSLNQKKQEMQMALKAYGRIADYGVAEFVTAATYRTAEIYHSLSTDLLASQRPKDLSPQELEQYNVLLEEQAYPFEEKAIEIHEANIKRVTDGIYDEWVRKSFAALGKLRPVRYAKLEKSEAVSHGIR